MRNLIIIILFLVLPMNSVVQAQDRTVLLSVDKSKSMISSPKQSKLISKIVIDNTKQGAAIFQVRFINGNNSINNLKVFTYDKPVFDASKYANEDLALQKVLHSNKVKRKRNALAKRIVKFINEFKSEAKYTNIVSSIVSISRVKSDNIKAFYFTDGIESSRAFRMLDIHPIKTELQAIYFATKDVKKLHSIYKLPKKIKGIQKVYFFLPVQMDKKTKGSSFIEAYWTEIFSNFGVNVEFKTF